MSTAGSNANMNKAGSNADMNKTGSNADMNKTGSNAGMNPAGSNANVNTAECIANRNNTAASNNIKMMAVGSDIIRATSGCDIGSATSGTDIKKIDTGASIKKTRTGPCGPCGPGGPAKNRGPTGSDNDMVPTGFDVNRALIGADINRALYQELICPQVLVPFWRVVKPYTADCLINNWYEERLKYETKCYKHNSTYRIDYKPFCSPTVDESVRRKGKLHNENGLPLNILFHHHDDAYYRNKITWYDQTFNGRDARERPEFLGERDWKIDLPAWVPERSDYPLQGTPTNWGLLRQLQLKWQKRQQEATTANFETTYARAYNRSPPLPPGAYALTRYATLKERSFLANPTDKINRDMAYKVSRQPEILATARYKPDVCEPKHPPSALYN